MKGIWVKIANNQKWMKKKDFVTCVLDYNSFDLLDFYKYYLIG